MLYACVTRFDVTENLEKFLYFGFRPCLVNLNTKKKLFKISRHIEFCGIYMEH